MEKKFFGLFQVFYPVGKQIYKLQLFREKKIYNVFHVSLLEQDTIMKEWVDRDVTKLDASNDSDKYKVEVICNSVIYTKKSESGYLLRLYYLVFWKNHSKKKISGSLHWPFNILKNLSTCFTKTILIKQEQSLKQLILFYQ